MSVKFLNQGVTVNTIRPTGYKYPIGAASMGSSNTTIEIGRAHV